MEYEIIRTARRSLCVQITDDLRVVVRAPLRFPTSHIAKFIADNAPKIDKMLVHTRERIKKEPDADETRRLRALALDYISERTAYFASITGLMPTDVKINGAKRRFGSCSAKNSLNFSFRLMLYPHEAVDYVIVHELAHIKYKNHGREFYAFIESFLPDYKKRRAMLKVTPAE